jgi:hypothetical protein
MEKIREFYTWNFAHINSNKFIFTVWVGACLPCHVAFLCSPAFQVYFFSNYFGGLGMELGLVEAGALEETLPGPRGQAEN